MEAKVYSEMSNPEIIQTLQREGDNQQYYEGQEERQSEQEQEGKPKACFSHLSFVCSSRRTEMAMGVPTNRRRAALSSRWSQRYPYWRISRDIRSKSKNPSR